MKAYMDKEGYLLKDWKDSPREIRRAERWLKKFLVRGATIPEAMWQLKGIIDTACENIRYSIVWKKSEKNRAALKREFERLQAKKAKKK